MIFSAPRREVRWPGPVLRGVAAVLWALSQAVGAAQAIDPACDAPTFQTPVPGAAALAPDAPDIEAEAIWLDYTTLRWPGMGGGGDFRLYRAGVREGIVIRNGRVTGAAASLLLSESPAAPPPASAARFGYVDAGVTLALPETAKSRAVVTELFAGDMVLVKEDAKGVVERAARLQVAGALDSLFSSAATIPDFGVRASKRQTTFKIWAPTAARVAVCLYRDGRGIATRSVPAVKDLSSGAWSARVSADLRGGYYAYLVDVYVPGSGWVRNRVTDPYSISLTTDSVRSLIAGLDDPSLKPTGWDHDRAPGLPSAVDMSIYELHVRDFSINDASVPVKDRGRYLAFAQHDSNGMRHLSALARAGLTDVHLLPVFDFATVPEAGCITPDPQGSAGTESQQAAIERVKDIDCYNWGYDPYHYTAPEGSYASDAADGAVRIREFRQMVQALHKTSLRVGMDVVYNHTTASGQKLKSVLDRIVPGYYHRLNKRGRVETSTCCDNTATENLMMEKLMIDSVVTWASQYHIDSFRFDLMGHQPRPAMVRLREALRKATGREIPLIGEGWNFGEVADGRRFVQASQLSLAGSGIGTFSDRTRDAVRGGGPGDSSMDLLRRQGYINGLVYDRNEAAPADLREFELMKAADLVRVGLAGSLRDFPMQNYLGRVQPLAAIDYAGQPAGYAAEPAEVVNYVENHDNQTLYDINAFKLPVATNASERARVQILGAAVTAFSQGIAYFHAGIDLLRSKSMDRNSFDSGDWFNRIDWTASDNYFGTGAPPQQDNGRDYALIKPLLANPALRPSAANIAWTRNAFRDLLRIRASSTLFRLRTAADIRGRLMFANTGPSQIPTVVAARIDGAGYAGANFREIVYFINVDTQSRRVTVAGTAGKAYELHPVHLRAEAADSRPAAQARFDAATGEFSIPPRTALVYVLP